MRRREFLMGGAAALAAERLLDAQRRGIHVGAVGDRYEIPAGPVSRWNFHRLGLNCTEGATISAVPDDSGNGCPLSIYTGQTPQTPIFTQQAINGRGGFWPGTAGVAGNGPNMGALTATVSPLAENNMSVLWCAQMGGNGGNNDANMMQIGPVRLNPRNNNGNTKQTIWYNYTSGHGLLNEPFPRCPAVQWAGPVTAAIVNGFGASNSNTRFMFNRSRSTRTGSNWSGSAATNGQVIIGAFGGMPQDVIYHEVVVYNRALTDAELDLWNVYCNQMYGSPLSRAGDSYINRRVILGIESAWEGQGSTYCRSIENQLAATLGNWTHVEYGNFGIGGYTVTSFYANLSSFTLTYDSTLSGTQIFFFHGGTNDLAAGHTAAQIWSDSTNGGIVQCLQGLRAAGFKVIICTLPLFYGDSAPITTQKQSLNALITANWSTYADALCDPASDPTVQSMWQNSSNFNNGHPINSAVAALVSVGAPVVNSLL